MINHRSDEVHAAWLNEAGNQISWNQVYSGNKSKTVRVLIAFFAKKWHLDGESD
jgi:hypothetical protein